MRFPTRAPRTPASRPPGDAAASTSAALVRLLVRVRDWNGLPAAVARVEAGGPSGTRTLHADEAGRAVFELPEGTSWTLSARNRYGVASVPVRELPPGAATEQVVELELRNEATVSGLVTDGTGRPLADVPLVALVPDPAAGADRTEGAGATGGAEPPQGLPVPDALNALTTQTATLLKDSFGGLENARVAGTAATDAAGRYRLLPRVAGPMVVAVASGPRRPVVLPEPRRLELEPDRARFPASISGSGEGSTWRGGSSIGGTVRWRGRSSVERPTGGVWKPGAPRTEGTPWVAWKEGV